MWSICTVEAEVWTRLSHDVTQRPVLAVQPRLVNDTAVLDSWIRTSCRVFWQSPLVSRQTPNTDPGQAWRRGGIRPAPRAGMPSARIPRFHAGHPTVQGTCRWSPTPSRSMPTGQDGIQCAKPGCRLWPSLVAQNPPVSLPQQMPLQRGWLASSQLAQRQQLPPVHGMHGRMGSGARH